MLLLERYRFGLPVTFEPLDLQGSRHMSGPFRLDQACPDSPGEPFTLWHGARGSYGKAKSEPAQMGCLEGGLTFGRVVSSILYFPRCG